MVRNPEFDFAPLKQSWLHSKEKHLKHNLKVDQVTELYKEWDKHIDDQFRKNKCFSLVDEQIDTDEVTGSLKMLNDLFSWIRKSNN